MDSNAIFIKCLIMEKETREFLDSLDREFYPPSGSYEFYDRKTGSFYNHSGQALRDVEEYNQYSEGYTPFGDE